MEVPQTALRCLMPQLAPCMQRADLKVHMLAVDPWLIASELYHAVHEIKVGIRNQRRKKASWW